MTKKKTTTTKQKRKITASTTNGQNSQIDEVAFAYQKHYDLGCSYIDKAK